MTVEPNDNFDINFIIFDLDGVLVDTISSWVFIHEHFDVNNDVSYYAYMNNEIDDEEFMRRDIALWLEKKNELHLSEIQQILDTVPLMPGFDITMKILNHLDIESAIVSAGLEQLAQRVAKRANIKHVLANGLGSDSNGRLTGEGILRVTLRDKGKVVRDLISKLKLDPKTIAAVGNGGIDVPMLKETSLGIAFNPHDQQIMDNADIIIERKNLTEILNHICNLKDLPINLYKECRNNY